MATVAEQYKQGRSQTGEEYLTGQEFGLIPDEMKSELDIVRRTKGQNPSMLNFLSETTAEDMFVHDQPVEMQPGMELAGMAGERYAPWAKHSKAAISPHPFMMKEPMARQAMGLGNSWEVPATDPAWQRNVAVEGKLGMHPQAKAHSIMHEQIHEDIRDLVYSKNLSENDFRRLTPDMEHAVINYLVVQSGIDTGQHHGWIRGLLKDYQERNNLSPDEFEEQMEGWIDILNDAKRSQMGGQRTSEEPLSTGARMRLEGPKAQILPTEPEQGLVPRPHEGLTTPTLATFPGGQSVEEATTAFPYKDFDQQLDEAERAHFDLGTGTVKIRQTTDPVEKPYMGTTPDLVDQVQWDALGGRIFIEDAILKAWTKLKLAGQPEISSGYRSLERQLAQGIDNPDSRHIDKMAIDLFVGDMSAQNKKKLKQELLKTFPKQESGQPHWINIEGNHIHIADQPGEE